VYTCIRVYKYKCILQEVFEKITDFGNTN